ncbi:MAG TPA: replicative DNA helicase [Candidatus Enterenecus stercoripullorum]|nr:replicative DNA helicase [Candidatus Enterenecus stercoripullorum]
MNELDNLALPHSVEAEQAVLGSMLLDERCVPDVIARLSPDDFYLRQNREIYQVLYGMFNRFETIDPVTVLDRMKQAGVYDENASLPYLSQLMEITPTAANVLEYADIVADKALLRRVGETAGELEEMVRKESGTAQQILEVAEQRIYAIRQGKSSREMAHIATVLGQVWDTIKERQSSGEEFPGISTGLIDLDRRISGLNNSDLIILAARPGMGKTSLALNIALEAGKRSGKAVAVFSLEMSREQLGMRLISMESLIDNKKLLTGRLSGEEEWTRVAMAVATLSQANIYIDDDATLSVADMNAKCRRVKNLGLVVVDYLQLMTSAGGPQRANDNRQQIVSDMSRSLKLMAKELNVPVLCLSQLSRANESRSAGQRRPMLSDLRESGSIEQDADIVMFIYRESYYENDTENPNVAECIVAKNRHGETGTVLLEWRPEFTTFRNLAYRDDEDEY